MRRKWLVIGGVALIAALAAAAWAGRDVYRTARIGTAYLSKQTCSCLFVAGRSRQSCSTDYDAEAIEVLSLDVGADSVTASALGGLVSTKAQFVPGFGCHPAN